MEEHNQTQSVQEHFRAPWSTRLKVITAAALLICGAVYFTADLLGSLLILALVILCLVFAVRGYSITDDKLLIHRLGWVKSFDLSDLSTVELSPGANIGSIRAWGIGGVFSFVGYFRNAVLGNYRAYVTDSKNAVVLVFNGSKIVVTPANPANFVTSVRAKSKIKQNESQSK